MNLNFAANIYISHSSSPNKRNSINLALVANK